MSKIKLENNKKYSMIITIANIVVLLLLLVLCFNKSIWIDEVFDLRMMRQPYSYFLFTVRDAAPPFHFFILKLFVDTAAVIAPGLHYLYVAKICSVVPFILIFVLSHTFVKKVWGKFAASLCGLLSVTMPIMFSFGLEIRQYSWSIFLAFVWFLAFYRYIEKENVKWALIETAFAGLAVFAHYFIAFGVLFAYIFYGVYCLVKKRYKGLAILAGISFGLCIIAVPFLFKAIKALVTMAQNFWLASVEPSEIVESLVYPFRPDMTKFGIDKVGMVLLLLMLIYLVICIAKAKADNTKMISMIGILMPYAVAVIGIAIGMFLFPVYQPRYIMPVMACFWLAVSIALGKYVPSDKVKFIILAVLMFIACIDVAKHTKDEIGFTRNIHTLEDILEENSQTIVVDNGRVFGIVPYYTDREYLSIGGAEDAYASIVDRLHNGEELLYIHCDSEHIEPYVQDLEANGITMEKLADCGIEYLDVEVYMLHR